MRYTYTVSKITPAGAKRVDIHMRATSFRLDTHEYVVVEDNLGQKPSFILSNNHELDDWISQLEQIESMKPGRVLDTDAGYKIENSITIGMKPGIVTHTLGEVTYTGASQTGAVDFAKLPLGQIGLEKIAPNERSVAEHINPSHYQALMLIPLSHEEPELELQWLEHLQYHAHFRKPEAFKAAVEMQARKYLDRCGGKDTEFQELLKAIWYLKFLAAYAKNGNKPIFVKDIERILSEK